MKTRIPFFLLLIFPFLTIAQNEESQGFNNKIAAGGYVDGRRFILETSYSKNLRHRNELVFSLDYIREGTSNEFMGSLGFNYSFFKKDTKFNFSVGMFLGVNCYYVIYYDTFGTPYMTHRTFYRYGPLLLLNLSPSYQISNQVSIILDIKMGPAYQLNNSKDFYSGWIDDYYEEYAWAVKGTIALKVGYAF